MAAPTPLDPEKFIPFTLYALLIGIAAALTVEVINGFEPPSEGHRFYLWVLFGIGALSLVIFSRKYDKWLRQIIERRKLAGVAESVQFNSSFAGKGFAVSGQPGSRRSLCQLCD